MGNRRLGALVLTVLVAVSVARQAVAQTPAPTAALDSITCWWKANRTTVHVGEHFRLVLTCGIPRDDSADLVPDWKQLDPGAIQLAPYEVLAGVRHQDVDAGASRYIQYEYTLRLLDSAAFGQEVDIPSLAVTYGVEVTQGGTTQRGRERQYLLPPLPMQIASLVPKNAADIRDASDETFGSIEARRFRATSKLVAAVVFFCISVVLAALAGASALRRYRVRPAAVAPLLTPVALVRRCATAVARLEWDVAREGWTPDLAARAVAVFRIVAAVALGRPVAQAVTRPETPLHQGQLQFQAGLLGRTRLTVSARTAPPAIVQRIAALGATERERREQVMLERVRDALAVFTTACYGREAAVDAATLSRALHQGADGLRRLNRFPLRPRRRSLASVKSAAGVGEMVWSR